MKKSAVDRQEGEDKTEGKDVEAVCVDVARDETTQKEQPGQQKESPDEGGEGQELSTGNEEKEKTLPEEKEAKEAGKDKVENEERLGEKRERRARKGSINEDTCPQPTGAAVDHDE